MRGSLLIAPMSTRISWRVVLGQDPREAQEPHFEVPRGERRGDTRLEGVEDVPHEAEDVASQLGLGHERERALGEIREEHRRLGARREVERARDDLKAVDAREIGALAPEIRERDFREELQRGGPLRLSARATHGRAHDAVVLREQRHDEVLLRERVDLQNEGRGGDERHARRFCAAFPRPRPAA